MPEEHFLTARRSGDEFCMMIYDCGDREQVIRYLEEFFLALRNTPVVLSDTESRVMFQSMNTEKREDGQRHFPQMFRHCSFTLPYFTRKVQRNFSV